MTGCSTHAIGDNACIATSGFAVRYHCVTANGTNWVQQESWVGDGCTSTPISVENYMAGQCQSDEMQIYDCGSAATKAISLGLIALLMIVNFVKLN